MKYFWLGKEEVVGCGGRVPYLKQNAVLMALLFDHTFVLTIITCAYWSFNRNTLLDDKAKLKSWGQLKWMKCAHFTQNHAFRFEIHKTADFHSNLLVSCGLLTEGYHKKCTHFKLKCAYFTRFIQRPFTRYSDSLVYSRVKFLRTDVRILSLSDQTTRPSGSCKEKKQIKVYP